MTVGCCGAIGRFLQNHWVDELVDTYAYAGVAGVEVKFSVLSGYFATAGYQVELCKTGFAVQPYRLKRVAKRAAPGSSGLVAGHPRFHPE